MTLIETFVVENNDLMREGVKAFISGKNYRVTAEYKNIEKILSLQDATIPQLIIIGINLCMLSTYNSQDEITKLRMHIGQARTEFPGTRFILLISQKAAYHIPDLYFWDVDGYICRDVTKDGFMNYLNLAMMGERVVPAQLSQYNGHGTPSLSKSNENGHLKSHTQPEFSTRENDILHQISHGKSNKKIAMELSISESTVKVHTKTILRKLGVKNRTQAALWALKHGITGATESIVILGLTQPDMLSILASL